MMHHQNSRVSGGVDDVGAVEGREDLDELPVGLERELLARQVDVIAPGAGHSPQVPHAEDERLQRAPRGPVHLVQPAGHRHIGQTIRDGPHGRYDLLGRFPVHVDAVEVCLLYTSPSPRDRGISRMPSSA